MNLIDNMDNRATEMTESERKIYRSIKDNPLAFSMKSIGSVADELGLSKTSVMRFAKSLGFKGYSEFKKTLQEEQIKESSPADRLRKLYESDYINSAYKTKVQEIENIETTMINLNEKKFNDLIEKIIKAKHIHVIGWKVSNYLAEVLVYRLNHLGIRANKIARDSIDFDEGLMHVDKGDLVIGIDFYKYSKAIERGLEVARTRGVDIAIITDDHTSPHTKFTDLLFFTQTKTDLLMNSMIGPLFLINLIISEIFYRMDERSIELLSERHEIVEKSQEYY